MRTPLRLLWIAASTALVLQACVPPHPGPWSAAPPRERLSERDLLTPFEQSLSGATTPEAQRAAVLLYGQAQGPVLGAFGAVDDQPSHVALLASRLPQVRATVASLQQTHRIAQALRSLENGPLRVLAPNAVVVVAVTPAPLATAQGTLDGRPALLVNVGSPELPNDDAVVGAIARALTGMALEAQSLAIGNRRPDTVAAAVQRAGAEALVARSVLPTNAPAALGLSAERIASLERRRSQLALELLTQLESANPAEQRRFFDPKSRDPLLPAGSGVFISDVLGQALAQRLGSSEQVLRLPTSEFVREARTSLNALAQP